MLITQTQSKPKVNKYVINTNIYKYIYKAQKQRKVKSKS